LSGIASSAIAKPFGAPATLRVSPIEHLVPAGKLRVVVGQMLGDEALQISIDPLQRPPFAHNAVAALRKPKPGAA
jgi:ribosomal protein L18E